MLSNAYLLAKIGADTAENEQHFAEILPKIGNYPTGRLGGLRREDSANARIDGAAGGRWWYAGRCILTLTYFDLEIWGESDVKIYDEGTMALEASFSAVSKPVFASKNM